MTLDERLNSTVRYIVDRSMLWAFVIVLVAACILGWSYQSGVSYLWAAIAVAIVLGEVGAIHKAVEAYRERNWIAVGAGATVWALCFGYSFVQSLGVAATSQDSGVALRQAKHVTYEHASSDEASLKTKLERLETARAKMQPQRTAAEARAVMSSTEAHRWWAMTENCSATKGPQTRAWCDNYRAAQADLTLWDLIGTQDHKIEEARAELRTAQKSRRDAPVVTSGTDPFAKLVNAYTGADIQSVADATAVQKTVTVNSILTLTALMLFGGAVGAARRETHRPATHVPAELVPVAQTHTNTVYRVDDEEARRLKEKYEADLRAREQATAEWNAKWGQALKITTA
jgi:hypothetical protein